MNLFFLLLEVVIRKILEVEVICMLFCIFCMLVYSKGNYWLEIYIIYLILYFIKVKE